MAPDRTSYPHGRRLSPHAGEIRPEACLIEVSRGRRIQIDVWGWGTLSEEINNDQAAKLAFDPGFSPSLAAHTRAINTLIEGQEKLAPQAQLSELAASVARLNSAESVKLPTDFADRMLGTQLSRTLRRRGFADVAKELADLAEQVMHGALSLASNALRFEVLDRAARAVAAFETSKLNNDGGYDVRQAVSIWPHSL